MKALILGCKGQLGKALVSAAPDTVECRGVDLPELDITNIDALLKICRQTKPTVIINAAAYTAVDQAETEIELATAVNAVAPGNVATAANDVSARLIHISTDFVFDGAASAPYEIGAEPNPVSIYGKTKRAGELAVLNAMPTTAIVMRTAWLYSKTGNNFVKTMLKLMAERDELGVVADQIGTPTWADSLASTVWAAAETPQLHGILHWTDGGQTSWYDFALAIQKEALSLGLLNYSIPIRNISTLDYPTAATRPPYSVLDCSATCDVLSLYPTQWRANLHLMLEGMTT